MKFLLFLSADCTSLDETVSALKAGGHEIGVLLIQDGVYLLDKGCPESKDLQSLDVRIFASKHHVEERGIGDRLIADAELVDYSAMVDLLMEDYDKVISM
ncbi:MAG: sulfurtransferase complex subunit TusB [Candidatus Thorarchaeota archaeon]|nr:sulfurtransferase complex subunit TusB [Candidatus Thorarchaeota archaeon]